MDHCSLCLDLKILLMTVKNVILRRGISADGHATMPRFMGTGEAPLPEQDPDGVGSIEPYYHREQKSMPEK